MLRHYLDIRLQKCLLTISLLLSLQFLNAQVQTQTKVTKYISDKIGGYLESLPVDYASNPTKKYPLLVFLHGRYQSGSGSSTDLEMVKDSGIAKLIEQGSFPSSFKVNGQNYSFIIISPQFTDPAATSASSYNSVISMIDSARVLYRVDTNRIYLTGLDEGGGLTKRYARSNATKLAAALAVSATYTSPSTPPGSGIPSSNLPFWTTHRAVDRVIDDVWPRRWTDSLNAYSPLMQPPAKLTIFPGTSHNAWDTTYSPNFKEDGLNVYEWMLQYTRNKLIANAGPDQGYTKTTGGKTIILDGSKSMARGGRIAGYSWSLVSGKTGTTIINPASVTTSVSGLDTGVYIFRLVVTHTDATTASDTVIASTQKFSTVNKNINYNSGTKKGFGGYLLSLPPTYDENSPTNYALLIFNHGNGQNGDGSHSSLNALYNSGLPAAFKNGTFPDRISLADGSSQSFIVVAPQRGLESIAVTQNEILVGLQRLIDTCKKYYRIDSTRIYMTGLSQGGGITGSFAGINPQQLAAINTTASYATSSILNRYRYIAASNLPVLASHNVSDPQIDLSVSQYFINRVNWYTPKPNPRAILDIFPASGHDSWTVNYDPATILDSANNYNLYQWLLQYTNEELKANAGTDQVVTLPTSLISLDGTKSLARGNVDSSNSPIYNRIGTYLWTQRSGPSATITSPSDSVTTVTGLTAGTYQFELAVTHTIKTLLVKRDTVTITVNSASPRQAGPEEKLTQVADSKELLDVKLNPNPVRSNLTVFVSGKATGNASLALYNLQGQKVSQQQFNKPSAQTVARNVQVSNLPSGAYAIQVVLAGKTKVIQFIKE